MPVRVGLGIFMNGHESSVLCFCALYREQKSLPNTIKMIESRTSIGSGLSDDIRQIASYILGIKGEYSKDQIATGDYFIKSMDEKSERSLQAKKDRLRRAEEELESAKRYMR